MSGRRPPAKGTAGPGHNNPLGKPKLERLEASISFGPMPSAEEFALYEQAVPGSGRQILAMAEAEAAAIRRNERQAMVADTASDIARVVAALIFAMAALYVVMACVDAGQPWVAGTVAATTIVAVVGAYLRRR